MATILYCFGQSTLFFQILLNNFNYFSGFRKIHSMYVETHKYCGKFTFNQHCCLKFMNRMEFPFVEKL